MTPLTNEGRLEKTKALKFVEFYFNELFSHIKQGLNREVSPAHANLLKKILNNILFARDKNRILVQLKKKYVLFGEFFDFVGAIHHKISTENVKMTQLMSSIEDQSAVACKKILAALENPARRKSLDALLDEEQQTDDLENFKKVDDLIGFISRSKSKKKKPVESGEDPDEDDLEDVTDTIDLARVADEVADEFLAEEPKPKSKQARQQESNINRIGRRLLQFFQKEVRRVLDDLKKGIKELESDPKSESALKQISAGFSTLKSINMMQCFPEIEELAFNFELSIESIINSPESTGTISDQSISHLNEAIDTIEKLIFGEPEADEPVSLAEILDAFDQSLERQQEPVEETEIQDTELDLEDVDVDETTTSLRLESRDKILGIFKEESGYYFRKLEEALKHLSIDQNDLDAVDELETASHSIRSAARLVNFETMREIASSVSETASRVVEKRLAVNADLSDLFKTAVGSMQQLIQGETVDAISDIAEQITTFDLGTLAPAVEKEESESGDTELDLDGIDEEIALEDEEVTVKPEPKPVPKVEPEATGGESEEPADDFEWVTDLKDVVTEAEEDEPDEPAAKEVTGLKEKVAEDTKEADEDATELFDIESRVEEAFETEELDTVLPDTESDLAAVPAEAEETEPDTEEISVPAAKIPEVEKPKTREVAEITAPEVIETPESFNEEMKAEFDISTNLLDFMAEGAKGEVDEFDITVFDFQKRLDEVPVDITDGMRPGPRKRRVIGKKKAEAKKAKTKKEPEPEVIKEVPAGHGAIMNLQQENVEDVDPEILDIFKEESETYFRLFEDAFAKLGANLKDESAIKDLERASHSLKSSARMLGFNQISSLASPIELIVERYFDKEVEITTEMVELFKEIIDGIKSVSASKDTDVAGIIQKLDRIETSGFMTQDIKKQIRVESEPSAPAEKEAPDTEILKIFQDEVATYFDIYDESMAALGKNINDLKALREVQRASQSLKTSAGILGFKEITELASSTERVIQRIFEKEILFDVDVLDLISEGIHLIKDASKGKEVDSAELLATLREIEDMPAQELDEETKQVITKFEEETKLLLRKELNQKTGGKK